MSVEHLHRDSHAIKGRTDVWWYEERSGVCLVVTFQGGMHAKTITIPWRAIRGALKRLDKRPDE